MDLRTIYQEAFATWDVEEALRKIDEYVRGEGFRESDPADWCDYYYSLADFMWKKGILTEEVKNTALSMIDGEFGLECWAESGKTVLNKRKKALAHFQEKLLSPSRRRKRSKSIRPTPKRKSSMPSWAENKNILSCYHFSLTE